MTRHPFYKSPSVIAAALILVLTACSASPTPYQVADGDGGYTDRKLESGGYQVTFTGNEATPKDSVQKAVLFRAAQVALKANSSHFRVVSNTVEPVSEPSEEGGFELASVFGGGSGQGLVSTLDFVLVEAEPETADPNVYHAKKLIGSLKDSVLATNPATTAVRDGAIVNDLRAPRTRDF